jgi:DNA-binding response OmpR family regulator
MMNVQTHANTQPVPYASPSLTAPSARVLLLEDDETSAHNLKERLEHEGHAVEVSADAESAEARFGSADFDLLILDLNLPRTDGLQVLTRLRARGASYPILVITGRSGLEDRVRTLDLGADDYVVKPFEYAELAARARALLRRRRPSEEIFLRHEDLELNRVDRTVKRAGRPIELTAKEFGLLEYLMVNAGRCLTRSAITEHVWRTSYTAMTNVVDVYINYLRNKIDRGFERKLVHTVRGVGYQFGDPVLPRLRKPPCPA